MRKITAGKNDGQAAKPLIDKLSEQMSVSCLAQLAEEKIYRLAHARYRREDSDYDKALQEADTRMIALYNGATEALMRQRDLVRIVYLRNDKLESAFDRLYEALFGTSFDRRTPEEPSREAVEELEAIRENIGEGPSANGHEVFIGLKSSVVGNEKRPYFVPKGNFEKILAEASDAE